MALNFKIDLSFGGNKRSRSEASEGFENKSMNVQQAQQNAVRIIERAKSEYRKTYQRWITAQNQARNLYNPKRLMLQEIFYDVMKDNHLTSVINSRILRVLNTPLNIFDQNGEVNDEATDTITARWALDITRHILEAKFYGYSVVGVLTGNGGQPQETYLIPRENVIPNHMAILKDVYTMETLPIDEPPVSNNHLFFGEPDDLGMLNKITPIGLFKRNVWQNWERFQQIFGVPPRIARVPNYDAKVRDQVEQWMREMGNSNSAIFPQGVEFELFNTSQTGNPKDVFLSAIQAADEQISKIVLGGTMVSDNGSSRSQSEVHERNLEELIKADMMEAEFAWNDKVIPMLQRLGILPDGIYARYDRSTKLPARDHWEIVDGMLTQGYEIDEDWMRDTFNVEITGKSETARIDPMSGFQNRAKKKP